jgi:hypothetical protein
MLNKFDRVLEGLGQHFQCNFRGESFQVVLEKLGDRFASPAMTEGSIWLRWNRLA